MKTKLKLAPKPNGGESQGEQGEVIFPEQKVHERIYALLDDV